MAPTNLTPDEMSLRGLSTPEAVDALQKRLVHCAETNKTRLLVIVQTREETKIVLDMCGECGLKCLRDPVRPVVGIDFAHSPETMIGPFPVSSACDGIDWIV